LAFAELSMSRHHEQAEHDREGQQRASGWLRSFVRSWRVGSERRSRELDSRFHNNVLLIRALPAERRHLAIG
jgi:hypothetical protein